VVGGNGSEGSASGSSIMEGLLTLLLSDKLNLQVNDKTPKEANPEAEKLRQEIRRSLSEKPQDSQPKPEA
jgi:hypothetical protein